MKRIRPDRWITSLQPPRNPRLETCRHHHFLAATSPQTPYQSQNHRSLSTRQPSGRREIGRRPVSSEAAVRSEGDDGTLMNPLDISESRGLNAPSHRRAAKSTKLAALHARLMLPSKLPLEVLARCLIDPSVDHRQGYNNAPFALLGQDLFGFYTAEYLLCRYPRLPLPIIFAAQYAYVGPATLSAMRAEWGVEVVAAPGPEVDPGLLQLVRKIPGNSMAEDENVRVKDKLQPQRLGTGRRNDMSFYRRGMSSRIVFDDEFGDLQSKSVDRRGKGPQDALSTVEEDRDAGVTVEAGSAGFVRALFGALHTFAGTAATKAFHKNHILSRHLQLHSLFHFTHPTEQLSRLCAREDFEPPVARLISETGRLSRTPVFVVGVYSGDDKLGEGAGASLNEARVRAAAAALRAWYLYSPLDSAVVYPSDMQSDSNKGVAWKPQLIDVGEVFT